MYITIQEHHTIHTGPSGHAAELQLTEEVSADANHPSISTAHTS